MATSAARQYRVFLVVLVGTVLISGCGGPPGPTEPTYTKDYVVIDGQPSVILSDGSVFALQREDAWQELIEQFPADEIEQSTSRLVPSQVPSSVDLRANQTPIRNQGGRNTCVAFATVAGIEAAYQRLAGMTLDLSEQYANHIQKATALPPAMVELPARETQLGAWGGSGVGYQLGWLFRLRFGLPLETDLVYVPQGNYENTDQPGDVPRLSWSDPAVTQQEVDQWNFEKDAVTYNIPETLTATNLPRQVLMAATYGVSTVSPVTPINLANLKQALAEGREVVFSVILTKPAAGDTEYVDGVWLPTSDDWGGHAMVMVGYDDATNSFLVKNSWGLESGTGRGQPAAADLDADGFIRMSYSWVPKIREALTVTAVRESATWQNQQPFLGDWTMSADYTHLVNVDGQLAIYHLPGAFPSSSLSGAVDRRLGTLYSSNGDFRVNGSLDMSTGHLSANFVRPPGQPETYDFSDGTTTIDAYLFSEGKSMMAGWSSRSGVSVPFYATLDGSLAGSPADTDVGTDAEDYLGTWRFLDDGVESQLLFGDVNPSGTIVGRLVTGGTVLTGVIATLDSSNPCLVSIDIPLPEGDRTYVGGMFCLDRPSQRNVIAGTSTPSSSAAPVRGFIAVRTGSALSIEITSLSEGSSFPRGSVNVPLEADVFGADDVEWTSNVDGVIGTGSTTAVNDLSYGAHVITATATAADGSTASDSVGITITNDPPSVAIVEPATGSSFCVAEEVQFTATVTDLNEVPTFTLGDDAVSWRIQGGAEIGTGKQVSHAFGAAGTFTVVVQATDSQGASDEASVVVSVEECAENQPPSVSITDPPADTGTSDPDFVYDGFDGDLGLWFKDVDLSGTASDPEDGALTGVSLVWSTDRTDLQGASLGTGTTLNDVRLYAASCSGEWHEVMLEATDSGGLARSTVRRIFIWTLC